MDEQRTPPDRAGALSARLQRGPDSGTWAVPAAPGLAGGPVATPGTARCAACNALNPVGAEVCSACGIGLIDPLEHDTAGGATKIGLRRDQQLYIQAQCLGWMTANVTVSALGAPDTWQAFGAAQGRAPLAVYRLAVTSGVGRLALATALPGTINVVQVNKESEYLVKASALLAAQSTVTLGEALDLQRPHGDQIPGAVMQRLSGRGLVFVETCGEAVVQSLQPDEVLKVNVEHLALMDASVRFTIGSAGFTEIETVDLLGPGRVWLQTHSPTRLLSRRVS